MMKEIKLDSVSMDPRGWSLQPLQAAGLVPQSIRNFHIASMAPGSIRGNHVHPNAVEWLLVFGGPFEILWKDTEEDEVKRIQVQDNAPVLFEFVAGCPHTVCNHSADTIYLLAFNDKSNPETRQYELM